MAHPFSGFQSPTSNTTYTPNQFFDVVLPTASRGVVRLVAYMIRKTLGWSDAEGRPQEAHITLSYRDLAAHAGIAQSKIRAALDEAIAARFVRCVRGGQAHEAGTPAVSALYELCWDERDVYVTAPNDFQGFYAGNGNLTYIPNEFFDVLVPNEPLAVIKVVGAIIRHTIGFQTRYGLRRQQIVVSFTELQRKTGLVSRRSLSEALHSALTQGYLQVIETGYFDPQAGQNSRAATYGVRWRETDVTAENAAVLPVEAKVTTRPTDSAFPKDASKRIPEERLQKDTGRTHPKGYRQRTQKDTGNAPERIPVTPPKGYRLKNNTVNNLLNNSLNIQQQPQRSSEEESLAAAVTAGTVEEKDREATVRALTRCGFDSQTAQALAQRFSAPQVLAQIQWLPRRAAARNRLGLLRRAIEENWPAPEGQADTAGEDESTASARRFAGYFYAGLAGNPGEPAAPPSAGDVRAAAPYVARLLSLWHDETQAAAWGRAFGAFVQTSEQTTGKLPRSFVVALRAWGDAYYLEFAARRTRDGRQSQESQRRQHLARYQASHTAYLQAREAQVQQDYPVQWAAFVQDEAAKRQVLEGSAPSSGALQRLQLRAYDAAEAHRARLCAFFSGDREAALLDFWEWDAQCNPDRLQPAGSRP